MAKADEFVGDGDLRFAAELASHAVFADATNDAANELLASSAEASVIGEAGDGPVELQRDGRDARVWGPDHRCWIRRWPWS